MLKHGCGMGYIKPQDVLSPRSKVGGVVEVIHDPGEGRMSVARIVWDGEEVVASRWNGNDTQPLGSPISRGRPTWFVVDKYAERVVEEAARAAAEKSPNSVIAQYREMANDENREREAEEWVEGLIGDASTQR
jgi:hypothetical protein